MGSLPGGGKMMQIMRTEDKRNITQVLEVIWGGGEWGDKISVHFRSFLCEAILLQGFNCHFFFFLHIPMCRLLLLTPEYGKVEMFPLEHLYIRAIVE